MGKREAEQRRRQAADFKEAVCCPSAIVQQAARLKNGCARGVPGVTGPLETAKSHFDPTQTGSGTAPPR